MVLDILNKKSYSIMFKFVMQIGLLTFEENTNEMYLSRISDEFY